MIRRLLLLTCTATVVLAQGRGGAPSREAPVTDPARDQSDDQASKAQVKQKCVHHERCPCNSDITGGWVTEILRPEKGESNKSIRSDDEHPRFDAKHPLAVPQRRPQEARSGRILPGLC